MKFSQMKYERPDAEQLKAELNGLTEKLKAAKSYTEAKELFLAEEKLNKHITSEHRLQAFFPVFAKKLEITRFPRFSRLAGSTAPS